MREIRTLLAKFGLKFVQRESKKELHLNLAPAAPIRPAARKPLCPCGFRYLAARRRAGFPRRQLPAHALLRDKAFPQLGWTTDPVERVKFTRHGVLRFISWAENLEEKLMLYWAVVCLVVAIVAGVLGFGGIAGTATDMARILFVVFLILFIVSLVMRRPV